MPKRTEPTTTPFKEFVNREVIERLADRLAAGGRPFDRDSFVKAATRGLSKFELKDRVRHVAAALKEHLDADYEKALTHILDTLPEERKGAIEHWVLCHYVEEYGVAHFDASMKAMHELTQLFSCEFAIRPYLVRYPAQTLRLLKRWMKEPNDQVRRLCSEGTRPRLPWGMQIRSFIDDPTQTRFLLDRLVDDPAETVRKSVANHVNDIAKDHPEYAVEIARDWLKKPTKDREWAAKHALRTLIKKGHPGALGLMGYGAAALKASFRVAPKGFCQRTQARNCPALSERRRFARCHLCAVDHAPPFRDLQVFHNPFNRTCAPGSLHFLDLGRLFCQMHVDGSVRHQRLHLDQYFP